MNRISRRRSLTAAIAFPFIRLAAAPAGRIQVTPTEDHRVFLFHEGYQAKWQIRLPEVVSAREGTFLTSTRPKMKWREYEDGTIGTDWRPDEAYSREAYEKMGRRLKMIQGLEISPRIRVGPNRIDLSLRLKNVSDLPFHSVSADGGCLQHLTERFFDQDLKTSYLVTAAGLTPLNETNRSIAIRAKYFFNPAWFEMADVKAYEFFWGCSETRPAGARSFRSPAREPARSALPGAGALEFARIPTRATAACTPRHTWAKFNPVKRSLAVEWFSLTTPPRRSLTVAAGRA